MLLYSLKNRLLHGNCRRVVDHCWPGYLSVPSGGCRISSQQLEEAFLPAARWAAWKERLRRIAKDERYDPGVRASTRDVEASMVKY